MTYPALRLRLNSRVPLCEGEGGATKIEVFPQIIEAIGVEYPDANSVPEKLRVKPDGAAIAQITDQQRGERTTLRLKRVNESRCLFFHGADPFLLSS